MVQFKGVHVKSIAVCLFNSYTNDDNERIIGEVIEQEAPECFVSLSTEVDPRIREYPRASTTVLNVYSMPRIRDYTERLEKMLGLDIKYMHSGGGGGYGDPPGAGPSECGVGCIERLYFF